LCSNDLTCKYSFEKLPGENELKKLVLFNNKGGVGKTTLTANLCAYLALKRNLRVLVVDCDPQCNITQLFLGDDRTIDLYWSEVGGTKTKSETILDAVRPIMDGGADVDLQVSVIPKKDNRFGADLLPGHPRFSAIEDQLSRAWGDLTAAKIGGFRITHWLRFLLNSLEKNYDVILIDVGPSLGSINRSVLTATDGFVTPLGSDVFSLLGIRNIAQWMQTWFDEYKLAVKNAGVSDQSSLDKYSIPTSLEIERGYVGYTLQQYITKSKTGVRRATVAFENIIQNVPKEIELYLSKFRKADVSAASAHLGDIPNLFSLIPLAQSVNAPIFSLRGADGLVGSQFGQAKGYESMIAVLGDRLLHNIKA
jgi:cellulose biosynthesis protein BcsQ